MLIRLSRVGQRFPASSHCCPSQIARGVSGSKNRGCPSQIARGVSGSKNRGCKQACTMTFVGYLEATMSWLDIVLDFP